MWSEYIGVKTLYLDKTTDLKNNFIDDQENNPQINQ